MTTGKIAGTIAYLRERHAHSKDVMDLCDRVEELETPSTLKARAMCQSEALDRAAEAGKPFCLGTEITVDPDGKVDCKCRVCQYVAAIRGLKGDGA